MTVNELRSRFLTFFETKKHKIVQSAPMVIKDDPTLMFTNAGMNQFKDIFLGNAQIKFNRIADTQKCLRVSGKHNDLEEVGHDTYHHTMFEMLGNWSFGDYFKKEAIEWAWEFLVDNLKIDKDRLYATVFEGDKTDNLDKDNEAFNNWKLFLPEDRIINGSKKDNFWEMGNQGPCGPCSEIHIDLRDDAERKKIDGKELINKDHPLVIEIWNLVFIQYNRKANGELEQLPLKHIDTGMGLERLAMVTQNKKSNYDTDVFQPLIQEIAKKSNTKYGENKKQDIAMRVIADHLRAISFSIADGQLPSNNGAGYVIRRILRRAVRYGFQFLNFKQPFIYKLLYVLIENMGNAFPELVKQQDLISKVILEEEMSFLKTLETGIKLLNGIIEKTKKENKKLISGKIAFELYDTYGFPLDLTQLILKENNLSVDIAEYNNEMKQQKMRSKNAAIVDKQDWIIIADDDIEEFIGYDQLQTKLKITKYREINIKGKKLYQLVFNFTPFYAESGGQIGDTGYIENSEEKISIIDTQKENNLIIHITKSLPKNINLEFNAVVNKQKRNDTACHHSATHLLHFALRKILGEHVEQKGSLVKPNMLRFDFSHFQKLTDEEIVSVEKFVNNLIRQNNKLDEKRAIPINEAKKIGAMALFGEKYGDIVRVIKFGDSIELCGGTHVKSTGEIGCFKIISESAIASGVRRIEAVTGLYAEDFINKKLNIIKNISSELKNSPDIEKSIKKLIDDNNILTKKIEYLSKQIIKNIKQDLKNNIEKINSVSLIISQIDIDNAQAVKDLAFQLKGEIDNLILVLGAVISNKPNITVMISDDIVKEKNINAGNIIRQIAAEIKGGGGGQAYFATAGGKDVAGISNALKKARNLIINYI